MVPNQRSHKGLTFSDYLGEGTFCNSKFGMSPPGQGSAAPFHGDALPHMGTVSLAILSDRSSSSGARWQKEADVIGRSLKETGVCKVKLDTPTSDSVETMLSSAKEFFAKPSNEKLPFPGYLEVNTHREMFNYSPREVNELQPDELEKIAEGNYDFMGSTAHTLLHCVARSQVLGLRGDTFTSLLDDEPLPQNVAPASALSLLKYHRAEVPTGTTSISSGSLSTGVIGTEAHVDKGLLTLLVASECGLQIQMGNGEWVDVPEPKGQSLTATVLVGFTLEHATCGILRATRHRVLSQPNAERFSLAYRQRAFQLAKLEPAHIARGGHEVRTPYNKPICVSTLMELFAHSVHTPLLPSISPATATPPTPTNKRPQASGESPSAKKQQTSANSQGGIASVPRDRSDPEPSRNDAIIDLIVKSNHNNADLFRIRRTCQLRNLFDTYKKKMALDHVRFIYSDMRLYPAYTPLDYDMESGDIIQVMQEQMGD